VTTPYPAPLRAVDHVESEWTDGVLVVSAVKEVVADDPYLDDHFPGNPIYPGVFVIETVRQAVVAALAAEPLDLAAVRSVRFLDALRPGDRLCVRATVEPGAGRAVRVDARCWRDGGDEDARVRVDLYHVH
jgi:3-hydroxyacyl-[acyl-carrier-protein] dehydratase